MVDLPKDKKIILFDGVCNFCNNSVQKIISYDKKNQFIFASIQSDIGIQIANYLGIDTLKTDTIILYEPNIAYYIKATAALKIAKEFGGLWNLILILDFIPESILNIVYDFIAKNRYKWFGKSKNCAIPSEEVKNKFL